MGDVSTFLAGARLDVLGFLLCVALAIHRKYLVLGREFDSMQRERDDERKAREKVEEALKAANEQQIKVNEANAQMAALVPDLLKLASSHREGSAHEASQ